MLPATLCHPSKPHAIGRLGLSPCYVALFFRGSIECPVALSASGRNYRGTKVAVRGRFKKESGEAKGEVGGSSARGRIHGGRLLQISRHGMQSKGNSMVCCVDTCLRFCERRNYFEEAAAALDLSAGRE